MNDPQPSSDPRPWLPGALLAAIGVVAVMLSLVHAGTGFASRHDPGPWMLPRLLAGLLIVGGAVLAFSAVRRPRGARSQAPVADEPPEVPGQRLPAPGRLELLAGITAYVAALPWAGFLVATPLLVGLLLWRMKVVWWRALLGALVLSAVAHGLFALLFKVPLPSGAWN